MRQNSSMNPERNEPSAAWKMPKKAQASSSLNPDPSSTTPTSI
jgi:hypothetical protein